MCVTCAFVITQDLTLQWLAPVNNLNYIPFFCADCNLIPFQTKNNVAQWKSVKQETQRRVSAAIPGGRPPGHPRATRGHGRRFVEKPCPRAWGICVSGQTPPGSYPRDLQMVKVHNGQRQFITTSSEVYAIHLFINSCVEQCFN